MSLGLETRASPFYVTPLKPYLQLVVKPSLVKPSLVKPFLVKPSLVKPSLVKPSLVKPYTWWTAGPASCTQELRTRAANQAEGSGTIAGPGTGATALHNTTKRAANKAPNPEPPDYTGLYNRCKEYTTIIQGGEVVPLLAVRVADGVRAHMALRSTTTPQTRAANERCKQAGETVCDHKGENFYLSLDMAIPEHETHL